MDSKMIFIIFLFIFIGNCNADDLTIPTTYATNGQVTATNLNGNFQAVAAKINGGLDNDNADTTNGYRFFETKSTLPTAGSQGRTIFLTTDNTINFDTGSTFNKAVSVNSPSTGDIVYYNSGWQKLAIGSTGQVIKVSGGVPSWGLASDLSITSQAQGDILYFNGSNWVSLAAGTSGKVLKTQGAAANPTWDYPSGQFGSFVSKSTGTSYQAATDGIVTFYCSDVDNGDDFQLLSDSSDPPTTLRGRLGTPSGTTAFYGQLMTPVKKNDYYKLTVAGGACSSGAMYFMPIGS